MAGAAAFVNEEDDGSVGGLSQEGGSISSEGSRVAHNESAMSAADDKKIYIELSQITAEDVWALFMDTKRRGGQLARTIFVSGKKLEPGTCTPWSGPSKIQGKKQEKLDLRSLFLVWTGEQRVLEWVRLAIYNTVVGTQKTYQFLIVTHSGVATQPNGTAAPIAVANVQATDNNMARIAHLACHSDSRMVLNMVFGTKDRAKVGDNPELTPTALWQSLADVFVNNPDWDIATIHVPEVPDVDVMCIPPPPGLSGDTVKLIFMELKQGFTDLCNATFCKTGCNSTGLELYSAVWERWINGGYLSIKNKPVSMYVFRLWNDTGNGLPKYCSKGISPEAQVRQGLSTKEPQSPFVLSSNPRSSSSLSSPASVAQTKLQESLNAVQEFCKTQQKQHPAFEVLQACCYCCICCCLMTIRYHRPMLH
jgi:hypothetical protein